MMTQFLRAAIAATVMSFASSSALAGDEEGVPVTVEVLDEMGLPIATAVVRHPDETFRHRVNAEDGRWSNSHLYLPNGDELTFEKGMTVQFEVSAPGYNNRFVEYIVRKRKNVLTVVLSKMELDLSEDEDMDDPVIQFGRDKPID